MRMLQWALAALFLACAPALAGSHVALVIGNSAYQNTPALPNPRNDAEDMGKALRRLGFDVDVRTDLTRSQMEAALRAFGDRLSGASVALFYYAGHGLQVNGSNYLMPVDARLLRERDLGYETISVNQVLKEMEAERRINMVFLDACRDNPLASRMTGASPGRSVAGRGLARVEASTGTLISYATGEGQIAEDGRSGNSPYTGALLRHLETPGLEVGLLLRRVRQDVMNATRGAQVPWDYGSMLGEFYLKPEARPASQGAGAPTRDAVAFQALAASRTPGDFDTFVRTFPDSPLADIARQRAASLREELTRPPPEPRKNPGAAKQTQNASGARPSRTKAPGNDMDEAFRALDDPRFPFQ